MALMYQVVLATGNSIANTFKATIAAIRRITAQSSYTVGVLPTDHSNLSGRGIVDQHPISAITGLQTALDSKQASLGFTPEDTADKGQPEGYASLDSSGKVPPSQLPSYVDDVLEYDSLAVFPAIGEGSKIYVDKTTNKVYRWSGSTYVYITSGAVDSVNGRNGLVVLAKTDVGLGNVDNTSDANKPVSTATQTALDNKSNVGHLHTLNEVAAHQGLTDPNNDRILFWDDSASTHTYLAPANGLVIENQELKAVNASTSTPGISQLSSSVSDTIETKAATPKAVKEAYDLANSKANSEHEHANLYQPILVSGTNIKTLNGESILGSGNLIVEGGGNVTVSANPPTAFVEGDSWLDTTDMTLYVAYGTGSALTWVDPSSFRNTSVNHINLDGGVSRSKPTAVGIDGRNCAYSNLGYLDGIDNGSSLTSSFYQTLEGGDADTLLDLEGAAADGGVALII
jgi:hypothetical protein